MNAQLIRGDCLAVLPTLAADSVDAIVTDPPYHLTSIVERFGSPTAAAAKVGATGAYARASRGFMGKTWDGGDVAFRVETWAEALRVLKPGGHLVAFGGTRTYHRMACAVEDAGFEIRDSLAWLYGQGFPKSHNLVGAHEGWGTALKPALEPIVLARKPLSERTVAANVARWGTGALNIDGCRVTMADGDSKPVIDRAPRSVSRENYRTGGGGVVAGHTTEGRWPANVLHDGSQGVLELFPETSSGAMKAGTRRAAQDSPGSVCYGTYGGDATKAEIAASSGSAARFFKSCEWSEDELIIWRAKFILLRWNREIALTADNHSNLSKQSVASALSDAATSASQEGRALQNVRGLTALSTSVTPTELKRISEAAITTILNIESGFSPASPHEKLIQNGSLVRCAAACEQTGTITTTISRWRSDGSADPVTFDITPQSLVVGEAGFAPRFSYCAKASATDRAGSKHPTVKPLALMRYLCRLVTPPGGTVLDPFAGSGTTLAAALAEGFGAVGIEREAEYVADIEQRLGISRPFEADDDLFG